MSGTPDRLVARRRRVASAVRRLLLAVAVAVGAAVVPGCASDDGSPADGAVVGRPGLIVGVTANALDDDMPRMTRAARAVGVRWLREEVRWPLVEPRRGRWRFARYDALMSATAAQGVRVLPLLIQSPRWTGARDIQQLPVHLAEWQGFVRAVVRRYGPEGRFWRLHPELDERLAPEVWEVWNEAYLPQFSPPAPDPARYAALLRATVAAGRETSRTVRFLASAETAYQARDGEVRDWLADVAAADPRIGEVIDGLAVHPYASSSPLATSGFYRFDRLGQLEPTLARLGIGPRPLWITEMGWSTCTSRPPCRTPDEQGRFLQEALELVATRYRSQVAAFFGYRLGDIRAGGPADPQSGYGLVRRDGRRKPAWSVLRSAARQSAP